MMSLEYRLQPNFEVQGVLCRNQLHQRLVLLVLYFQIIQLYQSVVLVPTTSSS